MKIYVASSWRNEYQPKVVQELRSHGFRVYDFRNPKEGDNGFHWSEINGGYENWGVEGYVKALEHPLAEAGFLSDMTAMKQCDAMVLVYPCGKSAHLEYGWACGAQKQTCIYMPEYKDPELMVKMGGPIYPDMSSVVVFLSNLSAQSSY